MDWILTYWKYWWWQARDRYNRHRNKEIDQWRDHITTKNEQLFWKNIKWIIITLNRLLRFFEKMTKFLSESLLEFSQRIL